MSPVGSLLRHLLGCVLLSSSLLIDAGQGTTSPPRQKIVAAGIEFDCSRDELVVIRRDMADYLRQQDIGPALFRTFADETAGKLRYTLNTPANDTSTLDFQRRPEFAIPRHTLWLPRENGRQRPVYSVSDKEILLALMQHGRLTSFSSRACNIEALRDHVGIRQNIVAWTEVLAWGWPDGGPSKWNRKYWARSTPSSRHPLWHAVNDVFFNQGKYEIGCYAATRLVIVQGVLDYYRRIRNAPEKAALIEARLLNNNGPLGDIEPGRMWSFETGFDPREQEQPGKILRIADNVAPDNFVPGDWLYFVNSDLATSSKTGYEGSNSIYLGRNRFSDYYNDHGHSYTFEEKLDEVYQWRNGVFSIRRDQAKIRPLSARDYKQLARSPDKGGLLLPLRTAPYYFGFEDLPDIPDAANAR